MNKLVSLIIQPDLDYDVKKLQYFAIIIIVGIIAHRHYFIKGINNTYSNRTILYCFYVLLLFVIWSYIIPIFV